MPQFAVDQLFNIPFADNQNDGIIRKEDFIAFSQNNGGVVQVEDNYKFKVYNVKKYGAQGDGITDDTVAIQAAINDCFNNGGGMVYIPNGIYIIGGQLQNNVGGIDMNCQIYIPFTMANSVGTLKTHIIIYAETPPVFTQSNNPLQTAGQLSTTGVILRSTLTTYSPKAAVIGTGSNGQTNSITWNFNYTYLSVYNLTIQVANNVIGAGPAIGGISYKYGCSLMAEKCLYMTDIQQNLQVKPLNDISGFETGDIACETMSSIKNCMAYRCNIGFRLGEHTYAENIQGAGNNYLVAAKNGIHPIVIMKAGSFNNTNDILIEGNCTMLCFLLYAEHKTLTTGYAPYCAYQNSIVDTNNQCKGFVYHNIWEINSQTINTYFKKVGGANISCSPANYSFFNVGNATMNGAVTNTDTRARVRTQGMYYVENSAYDSISNAGFYSVVSSLTGFPYMSARRARGSMTSPASTQNDDILLRVGGGGYSGTWASTNNAQIDFISAGNHSASSQPTMIKFYTTPPNSATITERFMVGTYGGIKIAGMTTVQRDAIPTPPEGLEIYNTDVHAKQYWNGTTWKTIITD